LLAFLKELPARSDHQAVQRKPADLEPQDAHTARLAWWGAFVLTIALILGLGFVRSAQAAIAPLPTLAVPGVVEIDDEGESEDEGDEEELELEECEAAEEEDEEVECEDEEVDFGPPPACFLSSADAAVSTDLVHNKLRLAVRYTAVQPATVAIDYWLRGSRGPLNLDGDEQRFGRDGVFRLTQSLTEAQAKRVAAAKNFTVTVDPVNAPKSCSEFLDQHLSVRKAVGPGEMWTDTESTFRHARHK
jgi:hypothetical protein